MLQAVYGYDLAEREEEARRDTSAYVRRSVDRAEITRRHVPTKQIGNPQRVCRYDRVVTRIS